MKPRFGKQAKIVEQRLKAFHQEIRRRRAVHLAGYTAIGFVFVVLIALASGPRFEPFLAHLGLKPLGAEERGIYAECSGKNGYSNPLCRSKPREADKAWRRLKDKDSIPFSLY